MLGIITTLSRKLFTSKPDKKIGQTIVINSRQRSKREYYQSQGSADTLCPRDFQKRNLSFQLTQLLTLWLTCRFHRPQTTSPPPPFTALSWPSRPCPCPFFCCVGEKLLPPTSPDSYSPCALFEAPSVVKAPSCEEQHLPVRRCPRRLLGHCGAWLEWTISEEITRRETTIKWIWKLWALI